MPQWTAACVQLARKTLAKSGTAQSVKQLHFSGKRKGTLTRTRLRLQAREGSRAHFRPLCPKGTISCFPQGVILEDKEKNRTQNQTTEFFPPGRANHDPCGEKESNFPAQGLYKQDRHSLCQCFFLLKALLFRHLKKYPELGSSHEPLDSMVHTPLTDSQEAGAGVSQGLRPAWSAYRVSFRTARTTVEKPCLKKIKIKKKTLWS